MVQNLRAFFILMLSQSKVESVCRKRLNFLYVTKTKVDLNQNFRRSLLGYSDKATITNCKKILWGGKRMASCWPGGHLPPHATPWPRA